MTMSRAAVYATITGERMYQESQWGEDGVRRSLAAPPPGGGPKHTVGDFIVFMNRYMRLAEGALSIEEGHTGALHQLRKVAALAVACFEQHGVPPREGF